MLSTCFNFLAAGKLLRFDYVFLVTIVHCTLYSFYRNLSLTIIAMTINTDLLDILKLFFLMQNRKVSRSHSSCKCIRFYNFHTLGPASPQKYRFHLQLSLFCNSEHQNLKKRCPCRLRHQHTIKVLTLCLSICEVAHVCKRNKDFLRQDLS